MNEVIEIFAEFKLKVGQKLCKKLTSTVSDILGGNNKAQTIMEPTNFSPSKKKIAYRFKHEKS